MITFDQSLDALNAIPADLRRDEWVDVAMAAHAIGLDFDTFNEWSSKAASYEPAAVRALWKSIKPGGGIGPGTLFHIAAKYGWRANAYAATFSSEDSKPVQLQYQHGSTPRISAEEVWSRCEPATADHPYIQSKGAEGVPLESLRVLPAGDPLKIMGEHMAGALVLPVIRSDGTLSSLQLITPPETAKRLKAKNKTDKPNLPGASLEGWLTVGQLQSAGKVYLCEGIGAAWACWKATGICSVVCFGWGRVKTVTQALIQHNPAAQLVIVPDVGKEAHAAEIAQTFGVEFITMPEGWGKNSDVCDLAQRDGLEALEILLSNSKKPPQRYKMLTGEDLANLPPLRWCVRGVFPAAGVAALYGPSASGKSFLALDMATAIAEGRSWFGCRVSARPVIYAALEGEAGFRTRVLAWEAHHQRKLPDDLNMMLQPFRLTSPEDIRDFAAVLPAGAVVFLDTLNRAAPTSDENSSTDMGIILEATKQLQATTNGLVCLVHHTGKDTTRGLRGHSSLFAALDAAIEVSRDDDRREWKVVKSKDGQDGDAYPFRLKTEILGTDEYGDSITSCVVTPDTVETEVQRVKLPRGGNQKLVLDVLRTLIKDGMTGISGAPPFKPCIELEVAVTAGATKLTCQSDRRISRAREAITGLASRGILGLHEGWLWLA